MAHISCTITCTDTKLAIWMHLGKGCILGERNVLYKDQFHLLENIFHFYSAVYTKWKFIVIRWGTMDCLAILALVWFTLMKLHICTTTRLCRHFHVAATKVTNKIITQHTRMKLCIHVLPLDVVLRTTCKVKGQFPHHTFMSLRCNSSFMKRNLFF